MLGATAWEETPYQERSWKKRTPCKEARFRTVEVFGTFIFKGLFLRKTDTALRGDPAVLGGKNLFGFLTENWYPPIEPPVTAIHLYHLPDSRGFIRIVFTTDIGTQRP